MKIYFKGLTKSGVWLEQTVNMPYDNKVVSALQDTVKVCFRDNKDGHLRFGETLYRTSDFTMIKISAKKTFFFF